MDLLIFITLILESNKNLISEKVLTRLGKMHGFGKYPGLGNMPAVKICGWKNFLQENIGDGKYGFTKNTTTVRKKEDLLRGPQFFILPER